MCDISPLVFKHKDVLEKLGDREPSTEFEAQAVLEGIRASKGYLDEETLEDISRMRESSRQHIRGIVDSFQETVAAYTKSIAEQLYSSKYRFLYELIQNADDSMYSKANRSGTKPSLTFNITRSCFIIETNEDGFTRANVDAICATGKSSKKISQLDDHIGEKGFGFKSVFAVAKKVHIQSGVWSFCFEHSRGQNGLGMVTPLDASPTSLAENITTRITLTLTDTGHAGYEKLVDAVKDLPNTVIFFLQKLENLTIRIERSDGRTESTMLRKTREPTLEMVHLSRETQCFQGSKMLSSLTDRSEYHVFTHMIAKMPEDERRRGRHIALVQLAFPVDAVTKKPKRSPSGQHVFAYLPLQRLPQLDFLIQSDFITSASRESVVDCAWNDAIRDGVAQAFTNAIAKFACKDHPLRYLWLEFVPNRPMEHVWKPLYAKIRELLKNMPILQTCKGRIFKRPSELKFLLPCTLHHGEPIFDDLPDEEYLALEYGQKNVLEELGVTNIDWTDICERLNADLTSSHSKMRSLAPDDEWHASCAALLLLAFENAENHVTQQEIKQMAIIPLLGGQWTTLQACSFGSPRPIYFPSTNGVPIPENLFLRLVETGAASVLKRANLFRKLGVQNCTKEEVIRLINFHHQLLCTEGISHSSVPASHFKYLFHFDTSPDLLRNWLFVPTEAGCLRKASKQLYFLSHEEYDTQQLLGSGCETKENGPAAFVRRELVESESPHARCQNLSWLEWLKRVTGARYFPPLVEDPSASQLSPVMLAVLEQSCEKFVGLLQAHWNTEYESTISKLPWLSSKLGECPVLCESRATRQLRSTYLPSIEIKTKVKELCVEREFPILKLPVTLDRAKYRHWRFLEDLGVGHKLDLRFYMLVLEEMCCSDSVAAQNVADVYRCMAKTAQLEEQKRLRDFFTINKAVYCPREGRNGIWKEPDECVWQAPRFLTVVEPLEMHYGVEPNLATFFSVFLGVRNAVIGDALNELEATRDETSLSADAKSSKAVEIYRYLDATAQSDADWELIRRKFNEPGLVLAGGKWCASSSCLWASPFSISEFEVIGTQYPDLERFFVKQLRIKTASVSMLVGQLTRLAKEQPAPVERMRQMLIEIGTMMARSGVDDKLSKALEGLKKVKFLPIKVLNSTPALAGIDDDFAIPDHHRFERAFQGHSVILDLPMDESQILDSLFRHLGLVDRYLSNAVKETSVVGEGALESRVLTQELRAKAYALFCCAAKFKSTKALRDNTDLFQQLSTLQLYTTDSISTSLVLNLKHRQVTVNSDRVYLHSEILDGQLKLYVPNDHVQQKTCYRSQLPNLLRKILGISSEGGAFPISLILSNDIEMLDDVMQEQDISPVPWITRPPREGGSPRAEHRGTPGTPGFIGNLSPPRWRTASGIGTPATTSRYRVLLEQIITHVNGPNHEDEAGVLNLSEIRDALPGNGEHGKNFDRDATFGERDGDQMAHDRKIGAAGELYVFETLSRLNLQGFSRRNWQSTIRRETQVHPKYEDLEDWTGRETADFVYVDQDGVFTQYLRTTCFGGFSTLQCGNGEGFQPIEYFIEVKTTTLGCDTRFFMSKWQYNRMKDLQIKQDERPTQIYLIIRVFNLTSDIDMRVYVDPWRFHGTLLNFEAQSWTVMPTTNV